MLKIKRYAQRTAIPPGFDAIAFNEFAHGRPHAVIVARTKTEADTIQAATGGTVQVEVIVEGKTVDDLRKVLIPANGFDLVIG